MSKTKKRAMIESDTDDSGSSEVEQGLKKSQAKRPKPTPVSAAAHSSSSGSSSGSDDEWTMEDKKNEKEKKKVKGGRVQVGKRMPAGRKAVVTHHSSSDSSHEEEGEDGTRESQGVSQSTSSSGSSSSESDSSSDESIQFDDGMDEHLVGDEEDRKKLSSMTEAEREQEMYNRYEKRQALKARFEIEQKLRRERRAKKKKVKEVQEREQSRMVRTSRRSRQEDTSKSKAMDELKAKRSADKQKREEQQQQAAASAAVMKEPLNAAEVYSSGSEQESSSSSGSDSEQGDSEDEAGGRSLSGLQDSAPRYISTVEEITKIKLSRFRLEKWVHMPFFRDVAVGCYVRVGIGAHEGRMVYRVCEITDVIETPKVYSLGPTKTNKCLKLRHGHQERSFRMEYVSNSGFTDTEFSKWKKELEQRGHPLPTTDFIRKKSKSIEEAKSFQFKEEDIEKIVQEKQKFRKAPTNYAMTKSRLLREKELAEEAGDSDAVSTLTQQLSELEEKAEQLDKQRSRGLSAISYINERNRQRNVSRAEQALKEEMADDKRKKDDDPFTRRRCKPTLVTLTKEASESGAIAGQLLHQLSQAQTQEDKEAIKASLREAAPQILSPTTPNGQKPSSLSSVFQATPNTSLLSSTPVPPHSTPSSGKLDDLFSAHDFDIHIDLPSTPEGTSTVKTLNKSAVVSTPRTEEAPKRSLNLADYKKRRGLI